MHWDPTKVVGRRAPVPFFRTALGALWNDDCLALLPHVADRSVQLVFADPPFNIGKEYGKSVDDTRPDDAYLSWCGAWLEHCVRALEPGGALFLYNIPKHNLILGARLAEMGMSFRHWIAVNVKLGLPIPGRLYPSHYSLLYFTKGKPRVFGKIRTPIERCRHCGGELKDYGGHRNAMNPKGVNLTDVWNDIPPVRHWKFKSKKRKANQLSTKLVRRAIQIGSRPGDLILDPFGGSGTTFDVAERLGRHWLGAEIEACDVIVERLTAKDLEPHPTDDVLEGA